MLALCALGALLWVCAPASAGVVLPDNRAYELVSPASKNGGNIYPMGGISNGGVVQASPDGNAVTYISANPFEIPQGAPFGSQYLSVRRAQGWGIKDLTTPQDAAAGLGPAAQPQYHGFSPDLSEGVLLQAEPILGPGAPEGYRDLYLHSIGTESYIPLNTATPPNRTPDKGAGTTPSFLLTFAGGATEGGLNYTHVLFEANDALLPGAPEPELYDLYEWTRGQLRLVNILPNGRPEPNARFGNGAGGQVDFDHVISEDGSRIFWTAESGYLYMRENGVRTVEIDASQGPGVSGGGEFLTASGDGSKVFFTDTNRLKENASPNGPDLYEYDTSSGQLTDLTPDGNVKDAEGADVLGVLGASDDGSYVYFVATGALAVGAISGEPNLYLWHAGTITFIVGSLARGFESGDEGDWAESLNERTAQVTADGSHVAFMSLRSLTGYNNADVVTGSPDREVYLYSATSGRLTCASCNPSGARPMGLPSNQASAGVASSIPTWTPITLQTSTYQSRYLSEDGSRLFFNSYDALVPADTNDRQDVYEWEAEGTGSCKAGHLNGCVYLMSSGTSGEGSSFMDASSSGDNVFFITNSQLVGQDTDHSVDIYDARVGGGFPSPTPPALSCEGEACRMPALPPPVFVSPSSVTFFGSGDLAQALAKPVAKSPAKHKKADRRRKKKRAKNSGTHRRAKTTRQGV